MIHKGRTDVPLPYLLFVKALRTELKPLVLGLHSFAKLLKNLRENTIQKGSPDNIQGLNSLLNIKVCSQESWSTFAEAARPISNISHWQKKECYIR